MEGLKVSKANLTVYIHPSKSNQVSQAVLRQLSSLLFTSALHSSSKRRRFAPHRILVFNLFFSPPCTAGSAKSSTASFWPTMSIPSTRAQRSSPAFTLTSASNSRSICCSFLPSQTCS